MKIPDIAILGIKKSVESTHAWSHISGLIGDGDECLDEIVKSVVDALNLCPNIYIMGVDNAVMNGDWSAEHTFFPPKTTIGPINAK